MLTAVRRFGRLDLMAPWGRDAAVGELAEHLGRSPARPNARSARAGRYGFHMGQPFGAAGRGREPLENVGRLTHTPTLTGRARTVRTWLNARVHGIGGRSGSVADDAH